MQFVVISAPTIIKSYSLRILSVILTRLFASAVCLLLQCTAGDGGGVHLSGWPGAGRDSTATAPRYALAPYSSVLSSHRSKYTRKGCLTFIFLVFLAYMILLYTQVSQRNAIAATAAVDKSGLMLQKWAMTVSELIAGLELFNIIITRVYYYILLSIYLYMYFLLTTG